MHNRYMHTHTPLSYFKCFLSGGMGISPPPRKKQSHGEQNTAEHLCYLMLFKGCLTFLHYSELCLSTFFSHVPAIYASPQDNPPGLPTPLVVNPEIIDLVAKWLIRITQGKIIKYRFFGLIHRDSDLLG